MSIGFVGLMIGFMVWGILPAVNSQASPYAKYAGTTLVVNFPSHPYYESAIKLLPEFTKETGIKVDVDKVEYMRMRDKQLLEMSKPKGDYDLISYVCMWKTEYVAKGLLVPLAPFFTNPALADPSLRCSGFCSRLSGDHRAGWRKKGIHAGADGSSLRGPFRLRNEYVCLQEGHLRQAWLESSQDVR